MDADIALLQEAKPPPEALGSRMEIDPSPWRTAGTGLDRPWKAAVVKLSDRVQVEWIEAKSVPEAEWDEFAVKTIRVHAMNRVDEWGPSDHCRIAVTVGRAHGPDEGCPEPGSGAPGRGAGRTGEGGSGG